MIVIDTRGGPRGFRQKNFRNWTPWA